MPEKAVFPIFPHDSLLLNKTKCESWKCHLLRKLWWYSLRHHGESEVNQSYIVILSQKKKKSMPVYGRSSFEIQVHLVWLGQRWEAFFIYGKQ